MSAPSAWVHSDVFAATRQSGVNHAHVLRLALRLERRSDPKNGAGAFEALANMARGCRMSEASAHRALRFIRNTGMYKAQPRLNEATLYLREDKLDWQVSGGKTHRKLGIAAALDDLGLSPETLMLYLHYTLQASAKAEHGIRANDAGASRATGICRDNVPVHRALLLKAGLLEATDPHTYTFGPPEAWVTADEYVALEQELWATHKAQRAARAGRKTSRKAEPLTDLPTSDTPVLVPTCQPQTPAVPTSDTPNCRPQTPKGSVLRKSSKVVNDDGPKSEKLETLTQLLGSLYPWFCKEAIKRYGEGALIRQLEPFRGEDLSRAWADIKRNGTTRNKPGMPKNLAYAYALFDLIFDDLQDNDPDVLQNLRAATNERECTAKAQPTAPLPLEGEVVRYQGETYVVNGSASDVVFLDGLDHPVTAADCELVADRDDSTPSFVPVLPSFYRLRTAHMGARA